MLVSRASLFLEKSVVDNPVVDPEMRVVSHASLFLGKSLVNNPYLSGDNYVAARVKTGSES